MITIARSLIVKYLVYTFVVTTVYAKDQQRDIDVARSINNALINVAKKSSESVVIIKVATKEGQKETAGYDFEEFIKKNAPNSKNNNKSERKFIYNISGSGFFITKDGHILTNRHVIEGALSILVHLRDGRKFNAQLVGFDTLSDLAVIKIKAKDIIESKIGNSDKVQVGEFAIAIGAPFSLGYSVTVGHVSALKRTNLDGDSKQDQNFIQTDASINPGNSGGPLVNIDGEVIGVNTMIYGKRNAGIGFAIPSNFSMLVADQLIRTGKVVRAWIGLSVVSLEENPEYREYFKEDLHGVVIKSVTPNSPAAKSNLKPLDIIKKIDGEPLITSQDLRTKISFKSTSRPVILTVKRGEDINEIRVTLEYKRGDNPVEVSQLTGSYNFEKLGLELSETKKKMLVVTKIYENTAASASKVKKGDIITEVNQKKVNSVKQLKDYFGDQDPERLILSISRNGELLFEIIK